MFRWRLQIEVVLDAIDRVQQLAVLIDDAQHRAVDDHSAVDINGRGRSKIRSMTAGFIGHDPRVRVGRRHAFENCLPVGFQLLDLLQSRVDFRELTHAGRVCCETQFGLSAPIDTATVHDIQPLVAFNVADVGFHTIRIPFAEAFFVLPVCFASLLVMLLVRLFELLLQLPQRFGSTTGSTRIVRSNPRAVEAQARHPHAWRVYGGRVPDDGAEGHSGNGRNKQPLAAHPAELDADHGKLHVELLQFLGVTDPEFAEGAVIDPPPFRQPAKVEPHLQSFFERAAGSDPTQQPIQNDARHDPRVNGRLSFGEIVSRFPLGEVDAV